MTNPEINWEGQSGRTYGYWIHPLGTNFKDEPGNYIYAADHEKEACTGRNGATHIHADTSGGEAARRGEESDLIAKWQPACDSVGVAARGW